MTKYDNARYVVLRKARKSWTCESCHKDIKVGDMYYRETIAPINPPPGMYFPAYCTDCGEKRQKVAS